ncbi:hypothetical protein E3N88_03605 [Mikania micrantha]|uniref:Integrase catalytic domain-containing protein n=1 Tax=Mikania micrantha TaxID=192012 RepID=A0A5N6Q745_9ASTR|nr:hypothetical protein E3N88_03605 [Mikania micrantha]
MAGDKGNEQQRAVSGSKKPVADGAAFQAYVPAKRDDNQPRNETEQRDGKQGFGEQGQHCNFCGKDGHSRDGCFKRVGYPDWWPGKGKQEKRKPNQPRNETEQRDGKQGFGEQGQHCNFCGKDGHSRDGCFKRVGYPDWWPGKGKQEKRKPKAACVKGETCPIPGNSIKEGKWVIDSGATEHIICDGTLLENKTKRNDEPPVTIPNGEAIAVEGRGNCVLPNGITVKNVLHIPKFKCNLLSDLHSKTLIGVGECKGGLYKMGMMGRNETSNASNIKHLAQKTRIRCDNGGEFTSNHMLDFYAKQGIVLETSCPRTPQQNGVVERKHRHLLETARALKIEANLPSRFWGECILTATHLINRMPSESTETRGDKFEARGRPGIFLGYPPGTKGHKVFDIQHNKIVISRDVKFIENVFPLANNEAEKEEIFTISQKWEAEQPMHKSTLVFEGSNESEQQGDGCVFIGPQPNIDTLNSSHEEDTLGPQMNGKIGETEVGPQVENDIGTTIENEQELNSENEGNASVGINFDNFEPIRAKQNRGASGSVKREISWCSGPSRNLKNYKHKKCILRAKNSREGPWLKFLASQLYSIPTASQEQPRMDDLYAKPPSKAVVPPIELLLLERNA